MPEWLPPLVVVDRVLDALVRRERDLPAEAFGAAQSASDAVGLLDQVARTLTSVGQPPHRLPH